MILSQNMYIVLSKKIYVKLKFKGLNTTPSYNVSEIWLMAVPTKCWCKHAFSFYPKCDVLMNTIS